MCSEKSVLLAQAWLKAALVSLSVNKQKALRRGVKEIKSCRERIRSANNLND